MDLQNDKNESGESELTNLSKEPILDDVFDVKFCSLNLTKLKKSIKQFISRVKLMTKIKTSPTESEISESDLSEHSDEIKMTE